MAVFVIHYFNTTRKPSIPVYRSKNDNELKFINQEWKIPNYLHTFVNVYHQLGHPCFAINVVAKSAGRLK